MSPTFTSKQGRRYRYYTCTGAIQRGWSTCPSRSVPAAEIERFVVEQIPGDFNSLPHRPATDLIQKVERVVYDGRSGRIAITLKQDES
jgi:hypothetical protein